MDVIEKIGAVVREVRSEMRDEKEAKVIVASRTYATTPDDLWNAITAAERLQRWFFPVTGDLRLGGRYKLKGNASGTIIRCEPSKTLGVTWEYLGDVSWVEVRLTPESEERTRLELVHTMITGDHWQEFGPGAGGVGWDLALVGLDQLLATGQWTEKAFCASPEGKAFVRRAAEGWARAHIAENGASEEEARAAAERNVAFYTGSKSWAMLGWLVRAARRAAFRSWAGPRRRRA